MSSMFAFSSGRRSKWVVLLVWVVAAAAMIGADLPGKFTDAEENESTSFLPGDAESTKALAVTEELNEGDVAPTVIVYRRDGGLTAVDRAAIRRDIAELNRITARYANTTPFRGPVVSRDGTSALVQNNIKGTGEGEDLIDPVEDYRDAVSDPGGGLQVKVAGPAGISADAIKVFENINGTLVMVAFLLVIVLLIAIYRSPVFWFFPILAVVVAEIAARGFGWAIAEAGVTVNGQSSSILSVLVIGAGTDYALLLVARYREELRRHQDKHEAMALAARRAGPAIFASGLTVMAALLALSLAEVNGTAGLGPIGAMGIGVALLVMLTFLPALLTIVGRRPFWPFVPYGPDGRGAPDHEPMRVSGLASLVDRLGPGVATLAIVGGVLGVLNLAASPATGVTILVATAVLVLLFRTAYPVLRDGPLRRFEDRMHAREHGVDETHGFWRRVGDRVAAHPHRTALVAGGALVVMALGLLNYSNGLTQGNSFRDDVESIQGQDLIAQAFPQGQSAPTDIVVRDQSRVAEVARAAEQVEGVAEVPPRPAQQGPPGAQLLAFLEAPPYSTQAFEVIEPLREAVRRVDPAALVGGPTAVEHDLREASARDTRLLIPLTLVIVFVILVGLLRAVVAPVILIATVVLSFLASLGVGAVVFDVIFGFPGSSPDIPLFAFIFLVALGVDYNILLMARVREEALKHGTRDGMLRGLAVTGGVITSAGIVLAGTFAVLGVLPLVFLTELGFLIAFGVLLDTFIVRSVLVPAITFEIGPRIWWPSSLAASIDRRRGRPGPPPPGADGDGRAGGAVRAPAGSGRAPSA
jgi:RND superfamily putative drug exporter